MVVRDVPLLITSVVFIVIGFGLVIWWAKRASYFKFLRPAHYYALALFLVAGILTWVGLIFPVNPDKFEVSGKQWIALAFSILISIFWWGRYVFSISPNTELVEEEDE